MICQNMILSHYHLTTFTQLPDWFLTSSWHCVRQRLQKGKVFTILIFCCVPHHLFSFKQLLMETTKRKEMEGRTKRGCSCTWTNWRMMIATRRTRLIRISFSEDNKVWLTVWFFFHFSLPLEVQDKDFNINFLFKIYPYKYFVLNISSQKFNMFANFSFSSPLLLRGKVNISQLQGEIEFNTFLCDKPYNWCI